MVTYDNDSSSDDENDYTTTNVVLGYASNESSGDEISHIGGHPLWLDAQARPPASFSQCKSCNNRMSLLLQLNADLQQHFPLDQRRLHIWICRKSTCTRKAGSIRAFREVKKGQTIRKSTGKETAARLQDDAVDIGGALFGASSLPANNNANPFATTNTSSSADGAGGNPFRIVKSQSPLTSGSAQREILEQQTLASSFADKLKIGNTTTTSSSVPAPEPDLWPDITKFPSPYAFFYLDAYPEELDPVVKPTESSAESSKIKYDIEDTAPSATDKDAFESTLDKTFQKFSDTIAQNPEQVLRYEFKGQPLLYSGSDGVASRFVVPHGKAGAVRGIPRCERCGSQRAFELQLTPYMIYEIEKDEAIDIDSGMEWGAIIIGTCANNCGEENAVAFREEWVGVQWEDRVLRK